MDIKDIVALRDKGYTYQQIAIKCGLSRQRIHQKLAAHHKKEASGHRGRYLYLDNIIYRGFYEYFLDHPKESITSLSARLFGDYSNNYYKKLYNLILGRNKSKLTIDQINNICKLLGHTYEYIFELRDTSKVGDKIDN